MKNCVQCQSSFEILERDRRYYAKINVPEPTHCPACRTRRRFAYRNERNLYHRKCDLTGKQIISMYPSGSPFPVYNQLDWLGDQWDGLKYERGFDFLRTFFEQFKLLQDAVPRIALLNLHGENSQYCNFTGDVKNSYLIFGSVYSEDCYYGSPYYSKNCVDTLVLRECEECYECVDCRKLYAGQFCQDCINSDHLIFCYDMQSCSECIGCVGLRNKKFHIFNEPYAEQEYFKKKKELNLSDSRQVAILRKRLADLKEKSIHRYMQSNNVENVSGGHVYNSKNTFYSFFADRCHDCSYSAQVVDLKDCYDNNYTEENELSYEYLGMYSTHSALFSLFCRHTHNVYYCDHCISCDYLFGCNGLRNKKYCILNKQYTKEEYEALVPKIIEHMKRTKEFGEFMPMHNSPFAYNETVAQDYFPLTREQALSWGCTWKDEMEQKSYKGPRYEIPSDIRDVPDSITKEILICEATGKPYKVIPQELAFYRKYGLPIPTRCPDQRHCDRLALRNPYKLWDRECSKCNKSIQTNYAPGRPEKVYCDECYLTTVY